MKLFNWIHQLLAAKTSRRPIQRKTPRLVAELLEDRIQPAALIESLDGTGNNLLHPTWGSAGADLLRVAPAGYADGISTPAGATRPDARTISTAIADQPEDAPTNDRMMSAFIYAWGQFIDHDLDLTTSGTPKTSFNIQVPTGDAQFDPNSTGTQIIPLSRSKTDPATGTSVKNPLQQVNDITAWLDGSMVYGSDATRAAALRTFSGGKMATSAGNLLPFNTAGLANANDTHQTPDDQLFLAGDVRANENVELTSIQTLFVREHNRLADQLAKAHPTWTDEQLYQEARRTVIAEIQAITYNEFLPALLGSAAPGAYQGYNPNVNPGIANEFSTAAFRVGHTLVGNDVEFLDNNGEDVRPELDLKDAFFNPGVLGETGIDPILKYLASDRAQEVDTHVVDGLRNFLFGEPGQGGLDLAALNIQRGRDHGLADYNTTRAAYGLPRVRTFADITPDKEVQQALQKLYGNVNNIDLWVGGLAEKHIPGASVGPTFARIISNQFARLRDGDRFWYQRTFSGTQRTALEHTTLADVIRRNTELTNLQGNVFFFKATITGTIFADPNGNGRLDRREFGLGGRTVQLLADDGTIVATTLTRFDGSYRFDELDLGSYKIQVVAPAGTKQTTASPTIAITRGMIVNNVNLGLQKILAPALANTELGDPLANG
jgi:hypothetical protein